MSCLSNWEFDYGGERGRSGDRGCCDPVDLLPSDPFGMNLSECFTAALASWVGDHAVNSGDFDGGGEFLDMEHQDRMGKQTGYICRQKTCKLLYKLNFCLGLGFVANEESSQSL